MSGDQAQPEGERAQFTPQSNAAALPVDDDDCPQLPATTDKSENDDANRAMMESRHEEVPSDIEEGLPNALDAPHMLSPPDIEPVSDATVRGPPTHPDAHRDAADSDVAPAGQPSRRASDVTQESALLHVNPVPGASAAADQPPPTGNREDTQEGAAGPSRPTRRAKAPSKTKRAPAGSRARQGAATGQVGEPLGETNADIVDVQPSRRNDLRSLAHLNSNAESVQPGMTRSKTTSLQRDTGMRDSNVGKRHRATRDEAVEEGQSSKRQRTRLGKK
ncbi:hypothetical protein FOMPIDRAFT_1056632 [Fomitopsis schrenkii]|uniref:Uncharacterized protein n=1 Tax=Fomitopsis schrenkii TaxID=2126942 RepID=S8DN43_FOMSC|nr:hypothetical protein FOMPIDRAFT_1056632 [Fomitopsis schrenkii]